MKRKAFTLIELLVVIAIIAILAAILFPVFAQAKDSAKKTTALSNVKQQALACLMYASDNEDLLPLSTKLADAAVGWDMWQATTYPYTKNDGVYFSPKTVSVYPGWYSIQHFGAYPRPEVQGQQYWVAADVARAQLLNAQNALHGGIFGYGTSDQSLQWYAGNNGTGPLNTPSLSQTSIARVAETDMVFEANMFDANYLTFGPVNKLGYCVIWTAGTLTWYDMIGTAARWNGGEADCANMVGTNNGAPDYGGRIRIKNGRNTMTFCDGHAKSLAPTEFYKTAFDNNGNKYLWYDMPSL